MVLRRITRLGRLSKRKLINYVSIRENINFSRINQVTNHLGFDTNDVTWEFLRNEYNNNLNDERQRLLELNNASNDIEIQLIHLTQVGDIDEIVLNMNDYRPRFTIEEILNRIILATISEDEDNFYTLQIGSNHYTLNNNVRTRLLQMIRGNLIIEEEFGSDGLLIIDIRDADQIIIRRWSNTNEYETQDGAFFKYINLTNMDFSKYGIFNNTNKENYDNNCFINALTQHSKKENSKLSSVDIENIKTVVHGLHIPFSILEKVADIIQHKIMVNNVKTTYTKSFGKKYDNVIELGLIENHYFINDTTNYTSYAINNYDKIKDIKNYNHIYKERTQNGKVYYKKDSSRCINALQAINLLIENKSTHLKKLTTEQKDLAHYEFYNNLEENFDDLSYVLKNTVRPVKDRKLKSKIKYTKVFFDFETNTNEGNHKSYLCCICYEDENSGNVVRKTFYGYDCGFQLLEHIPKISMLIAHNVSYDFRFIIKYLNNVNVIDKSCSKIICCDATYKDKKVMIKDSYSLINMKLKDFNKNLKLGADMRKEVISHSLYTQENIDKRFIDIDYAMSLLDSEDDKKQFLKNIKEWDLEKNGLYDCIEYSAIYCKKDCEILQQGYNAFRSMVVKSVKLNIDDILTIPSLSHKYFTNNKCYDDVFEIGGLPQRFIQKSVVGGRCMTNSNMMIKCFEILNDFDAVSLYPSAMSKMGFLKGSPKPLTNEKLNYEFLKKQDGYFVEIQIDDVGINREFPLMSFITDYGIRNWTNDMVGSNMFVNKYCLEDLIEFQKIEFTVIKGYYYNEGRNYNIQKVIKHLFEERLKWKKEENPIEMIYKLIMNSGYGKSIMKPIESENKFFNNKESFQKYMSKNYNYVNEFVEYGNGKYKVKKMKPFSQHFNLAHVGSEILSMSKRIMNRVMCLAEDEKLKIYYTDTDSIHIKDSDILSLKKAYKNKYNIELIGKNLGQFHTDFDLKVDVDGDRKKCRDIVSVKSLFLGKKAYIDVLEGKHPITNEIVKGLHIRMKGVNEGSVYMYAIDNGFGDDIYKVYEKLYQGDEMIFDLVRGGILNFKFTKDYEIYTDPIFTRKLKFSGNKITM